jgi:hypothetical protein
MPPFSPTLHPTAAAFVDRPLLRRANSGLVTNVSWCGQPLTTIDDDEADYKTWTTDYEFANILFVARVGRFFGALWGSILV